MRHFFSMTSPASRPPLCVGSLSPSGCSMLCQQVEFECREGDGTVPIESAQVRPAYCPAWMVLLNMAPVREGAWKVPETVSSLG